MVVRTLYVRKRSTNSPGSEYDDGGEKYIGPITADLICSYLIWRPTYLIQHAAASSSTNMSFQSLITLFK